MIPKRHTILVVDDEGDVVKSLQDLFRFDYKVLGATRATDGLRLMAGEEVHVVMSDQRMPEMTGVQFLKQIRNDYPDAIRLLFTGYADIRAVIDAINHGNVYRYIAKPWDPDELQTVIREAVERYDLIRERRELTEQLREKNAELQKANDELTRAAELKTAFIQVASHELRTPLTILLGLSRLAIGMSHANAPLEDMLGRVNNAGERLRRLVDQLLAMLAAGQFSHALDRKPTQMGAFLRDVADDVRPFITLRKQNLALDLPNDLGSLEVDALKLRDCFSNLLINAIKFTPDGGSIGLSAKRIKDAALEVKVSDTGVGIDAQSLPELFKPFFTGFDVSHHSSGMFEFCRHGLGLGLSLVKAFVEMHNGHIEVETTEGRGSTFTVTLPAQTATKAPQASCTQEMAAEI